MLKRRELPGFAIVNEKKRLLPWDTHYEPEFAIKTLLSKQHTRKYTKSALRDVRRRQSEIWERVGSDVSQTRKIRIFGNFFGDYDVDDPVEPEINFSAL